MKINTENKNLVRDTNTMALLNVNSSALTKDAQYKAKLQKEKESMDLINNLQEEVNQMKDHIKKITEFLNRDSR
jgi:hypothetical protein